jgi:hypothetical protein
MMIYLFVSICSTWLECSEKMGLLLGRDGTAEAYLNYSANDVCIPKRFRFRDSSFETLPVIRFSFPIFFVRCLGHVEFVVRKYASPFDR